MERLKQTHNPCDECEYSYSKQNQESYKCKICEFKQYLDAERQGLLLRLPCKVGDTVYCLMSAKTKIVETSILWIEKHSNCLVFALAGGFGDVVSENLGKTWFFTKEEAEQALARMEKENG